MQRPRGGPVWIERAIDHSPYLSISFRGNPYALTYSPSFFWVAQNPQGSALLYFKERKTLRGQPYFISRSAKPSGFSPTFFLGSTKPSGFSPTFFQATQNPQGPALLFFKEHKTLRVQPYFISRSAKPSGFSPTSFIGETRLPGHSLHRVRSGVSHTSIG